VTTKAQPYALVDLQAVVHEVISDLEARLDQTSGRVEVGDLPVIEADSLQMRQLFQNLIGNALKFHNKDVPPSIRVYSPIPLSPYVEITVADNGIGFDLQYLDRIFKPFERLNGRSEYEGTGMGLAICQKIVERHRGTITAASVPGEGSTFLISLPRKQNVLN
jgi:signal transduction histidine kinase